MFLLIHSSPTYHMYKHNYVDSPTAVVRCVSRGVEVVKVCEEWRAGKMYG